MAYSDAEVGEALVRLAVNKYDYTLTAEQTSVPEQTLRRWNKSVPKRGVAELLDRALERLLMVIPDNITGKDWAITLGILLDKWLLVHGQPNSRAENIITAIEGLTDSERNAVIAEAERILAEAVGPGVGASVSEDREG